MVSYFFFFMLSIFTTALQDSFERTAYNMQVKTARARKPGQEIQNRKAETRQMRKDSQDKTPGTGRPGQDTRDRTTGTGHLV
jgi:hypothetical protein